MCVDQLVQKYIDALPSQYRSDVPIPSSNNVEYWPVQFWLWDKHVIEIDTIDGSFGAWEHIDQAIEAAKQILDTKQPFERYCMNRLISDGISRGSQAVVVNFSIKPSKFKGCYDISYSDTVDHVRSSTIIYKDPEMGVIRVLKEDPDGKDRAVYVGRNADRIARYMSACCDRDAHKYMFEHPGKYAMRSTTKDYCITIVRREIQDAFDVVYPARELGKGNIKQMA